MSIQIKPLTIKSRLANSGDYSQAVIDSNQLYLTDNANSYWLLIVDRTNLNVVVNTHFTDNSSVPTEIASYDNTGYFMILCSNALQSNNLPQGAWAKFLFNEGAGAELLRAEQIYEAFNCGQYGWMSYIYVAILGDPESNGFEMLSLSDDPVMTLSLQSISSGEDTLWTPSSITVPHN